MSIQIVKPQDELIPSAQLEGLEQSLSRLGEQTAKLPALKLRAQQMEVRTKQDYLALADIRTEARTIKKAGKSELSRYEDIVDRVKNFLKTKRQAHESEAEMVDFVCTQKLVKWDADERAAAAAEERRDNEERIRKAAIEAEQKRKAAEAQAELDRKQREKEIAEAKKAGEIGKREADKLNREAEEKAIRDKETAARQAEIDRQNVQQVKVLPSTPTIAGSRRTTIYRFQVIDADKIPRNYMQPNEMEIGQFFRNCKDVALAEKIIPGVRFWTETKV